MWNFSRSLGSAAAIGLAVMTGWATAQATEIPARVTAPVDPAKMVRLVGNSHIARSAKRDLGAVSPDTALSRMILQLKPSDAQLADLQELTAAQNDPSSPLYHKWIAPAQFGARFGVAQADIDKIAAWLESQGFTVDEVPAGRQAILFSGTAAQLTTAFHTSLHNYEMVRGLANAQRLERHVANDADPQIPAALAPVVSGLVSLNDIRRTPEHRSLGRFGWDKSTNTLTAKSLTAGTPVAVSAARSSAGVSPAVALKPEFNTNIDKETYHLIAPYDFATIYNVKPLWNQGYDGAGQTIAIISPSDLDLSDVDSFRHQFGLPATHVNKIYVGANPGMSSNVNEVEETALDVEWSGAVAKGATIDLVVAGSTATTAGIDLAAIYIVNNNLAPIVSLSYGECELMLGEAGNAFYNGLWRQASAQGQAVFVATGDAGSTVCDQGGDYSTLGLSVNGIASTPYNVAVGGTDLYGTYSAPASYWSTSNDPATLASALSYVPEIPWNDSCGNPVLLSVLEAHGVVNYPSTAAFCEDYDYHTLAGGSGGASSCIANTNGTVTGCSGGYAKPAWQTGAGVPADRVRDIPDVSLFAGDGLWGSFYPLCLSQITPDGTCNMSVSTDILGAGGTSFATPAFAGIMAILNQKAGSPQGNPNPILYRLAASQSSQSCSADSVNTSSSCIYHDLDKGSNATPCFYYDGAKDCDATSSSATFGVVSGYNAGVGFDLTSGLGSVDANNLASTWASGSAALGATTTTMTLSSASAVYGGAASATVKVAARSGTPTGDFSVVQTAGSTGNQDSPAPGILSNGSGSISLALLPVGSYAIHAHYGGDASFRSSDSADQTIVIGQAATTTASVVTRTTIASGQSSSLAVTVSAAGTGNAPTGSIHIVDSTSGADLGAYTLAAGTGPSASARFNVTPNMLIGGANSLTIAYEGDTNYKASSSTASLTYTSPLKLTLSASSIDFPVAAGSSQQTVVASIAAASGTTLSYPISLGCAGPLPAGASCNLSKTLLVSPNSSVTVTIGYNSNATIATAQTRMNAARLSLAGLAGFALLLGLRRKLRATGLVPLTVLCALSLASSLTGCGGSSTPATSSVSLTSSTSSATLGAAVTFKANVTGAGVKGATTPTGTVSLTDTYLGSAQSAGSIALANGTGALTTSSLGIGKHSLSGVFTSGNGYPGSSSAPVTVAITSTASLQIQAVDAQGNTVTAPLTVNFQ